MLVGVVGLGSMGLNHVRAINGLSEVREIVGFDKDQQAHPDLSKLITVPTLDKLLDRTPDYCVVAIPSAQHKQLALKLAGRRIPTLVEKPIASSQKDEIIIVENFHATETLAFAGFVERFNQVNVVSKSFLEKGKIGTPLFADFERIGPNPRRISDVGVVLDLASHDVDLVQWIFGSAAAEMQISGVGKMASPLTSTASIQGKLKNSLSFRILVSWDSPVKSRKLKVIGTEGMIIADALEGSVTTVSLTKSSSEWEGYRHLRGLFDSRQERLLVSQREPLVQEHKAVIGALRDKASPACTLEEAARNMEPLWEAIGE